MHNLMIVFFLFYPFATNIQPNHCGSIWNITNSVAAQAARFPCSFMSARLVNIRGGVVFYIKFVPFFKY